MIGLHLSRDERFTQAERRIDHGFTAQSGQRVGGEHHARNIARDHLLHDNRQGHILLRDAVPQSVSDRPRRPQARPAADDRLQQFLFAYHIQIGILLSGEGQVRQVLGGGGGAHRNRNAQEILVCRSNSRFNFLGHCAHRERRPDLGGSRFECTDILR